MAPITVEALQTASEPFFFSVGFFETHRQFRAPTSVRDSLYSLPPANLPDTPATRRDMAAFKASARSLDQGIGAVLNALHDFGLTERTLIVCTTDHGLAFPGAKATLYDRGHGRDAAHARSRRVHRRQGLRRDGEPPRHLPDPLRDRRRRSARLPAGLLAVCRWSTTRSTRIHEEIFTEVTFHAAYEPTRAVRTERWKYIRRFDDNQHPVLANCDDSASKEILVAAGWADQIVPTEQLYDLILDPNEMSNLAAEPAHAKVLEELRGRLREWMEETDDPLLDGPGPGAARARWSTILRRRRPTTRSSGHAGQPLPAMVASFGPMGVIGHLRLSFWVVAIGTVVLYGFFVVVATISPGQIAAVTAVVGGLAALFTFRNLRVAAQLADRGGDPQLRRSLNRIRERRGF